MDGHITLVLLHTCRRQRSRQLLQLNRLRFSNLRNMHYCLQTMCLSHILRNSWACKCYRVQSFSRSCDIVFHLSPETNAKPISFCNTFPSVCSATMPSHSGVHFRMVVKPGTRPDFLENIFMLTYFSA